MLLRCWWDDVEVLLRCWWGDVWVFWGCCYQKVHHVIEWGVLFNNNSYQLTDWLTDQLNHFQSCYRNWKYQKFHCILAGWVGVRFVSLFVCVFVLLRCYWGVVSKKSIMSLNEDYFLTIILTDWLTDQPTNRTISRVATATNKLLFLFLSDGHYTHYIWFGLNFKLKKIQNLIPTSYLINAIDFKMTMMKLPLIARFSRT